ncbi:MAG: SDR family oxidoreductase [Rhodospirillaceae bacterium]|nr:MAG: SDR family oxidoreductase [Rhodospirillaceae bacterium]
MNQELSGKVAIVTGGANGIGRAIVELFLEQGAKVVAADIDEAGGKELVAQLGGSVHFKRTDVASEADIQALVDYAVATFGGLHVMVNNAAVSSSLTPVFLDLDLKDFQRVMNINVLGVMLGSQRAGRHMAKNGGGSIINVSSIAGTLAGHGPMTYRASKAAVVQLSKSIAIDLAQYGIRVNCLVPGNIVTKILAASLGTAAEKMSPEKFERLDTAYRETMMAGQPLKRQGLPRDAAQAALFYAGDRSLQVTGTVLPIDGGITAGDPVNHVVRIMEARAKAMED